VSDFAPSTPKLDEIVQAVQGPEGFERMREQLKEHLAGTTEQTVPAPRPVVTAPGPRATNMRVVYPHLNTRVELFGVSEADLDEQEKKIREFYGSR
jgi:hypothetical protein